MKSADIKRLAVAAMLTALATVLNFASSLFPTMSLTVVAISGLVTAVALIECGKRSALLVYIAAGILSLLLVPNRESAVLYILLFGHYPMTKLLIEHIRNRFAAWAVKLMAANVLFFIAYLLASVLMGMYSDVGLSALLKTLLLANAAFVLYDICMSRLTLFYVVRLKRRK